MTFTPFVHTYTDLISNQKYYDKLVSQGIQLKIKVPLRYLGKHFYHYYTPFLEGKIVQQNSQIGEKTQILSYMPLQLGGEAIVFSPMCKRDIANKWLLKTTLVYG